MLRSSRSKERAQTEPIAAIVAVSVVVVGIGLYAISMQTVLPGTSQSATADRTIDRVWDDIEEGGVFYAHDDATPLSDRVTSAALPAGATVAVEVTAVDGDRERAVATGAFPTGFPDETDRADVAALERYVESEGVPDEASVATQSIPVAVENAADVRAGTLRVSVW